MPVQYLSAGKATALALENLFEPVTAKLALRYAVLEALVTPLKCPCFFNPIYRPDYFQPRYRVDVLELARSAHSGMDSQFCLHIENKPTEHR
jgi:hypothetical protein